MTVCSPVSEIWEWQLWAYLSRRCLWCVWLLCFVSLSEYRLRFKELKIKSCVPLHSLYASCKAHSPYTVGSLERWSALPIAKPIVYLVPFVISLFYEAPWHSVMVVEILGKLHDNYKYKWSGWVSFSQACSISNTVPSTSLCNSEERNGKLKLYPPPSYIIPQELCRSRKTIKTI